MKKKISISIAALLVLIFLLVFLYTAPNTKAQTSQGKGDRTYYPSGKLKSELIHNEEGLLIRLKTYYESGALQSDINYKGSPDGPSTHYFENGKVMIYYFYKNALPEGRAYANYPTGQLAYEFFYANGYKTGTWKYYNEDGSLRSEETYQEGKSPAYGNDFSDNRYFYKGRPAFTVAIRDSKGTDTVILDQESYEALRPKEPPTGKTLFQVHCAMCHNPVKDAAGPMMKGVTSKRDKEWLVKMITNAPALIESGDKQANELYARWNRTKHPDYTNQLSRGEVLRIIGYLETLQ